jgi:hypothetical protein
VIVPKSQHAVALRLQKIRTPCVSFGLFIMLAAIELDNEFQVVTEEIDDVTAKVDLPTEVCARWSEPITQVPPQLSFRVGWDTAHCARTSFIAWHDIAIAHCPNPCIGF